MPTICPVPSRETKPFQELFASGKTRTPEGETGEGINRAIEQARDRALDVEFQLLRQTYIFRNQIAIRGFIEQNPYLLTLLRIVSNHLPLYFPDALLFLEVIEDPESPDEAHLVVFVSTNSSPESAFEKLRNFNRNWWITVLKVLPNELRGNLTINLELR